MRLVCAVIVAAVAISSLISSAAESELQRELANQWQNAGATSASNFPAFPPTFKIFGILLVSSVDTNRNSAKIHLSDARGERRKQTGKGLKDDDSPEHYRNTQTSNELHGRKCSGYQCLGGIPVCDTWPNAGKDRSLRKHPAPDTVDAVCE